MKEISLNGTLVNDCATFLKELQVDSIDSRTHKIVRSISEKIKSNQLVITKADKGQSIVIQNKIDYNKKVDQYLSSSGATNDSSYDFKGYVASVRKAINASGHVLKTKTKKKAVLEPNPILPRLYGLIKVHKAGQPIRPVVSFLSIPTYKL